MGPQDPKDVTRETARDVSGLVGELAALMADATHWLTDPEYAVLRHRLEALHMRRLRRHWWRRRMRLNEERGGREGNRIANGLKVLDRGCAKAGRLM